MKYLPGLFALHFFLACASGSQLPLPEVDGSEFELRLDAAWNALQKDKTFLVTYRLSNRSALSVCLGGSQEILVGGRAVQSRVVMDALCWSSPTAKSGETIEWTEEWSDVGCLAEASEEFAAAFPQMMCGAETTIQVVAWIYRVAGGKVHFGATKIFSVPVRARITSGSAEPEPE